jgi:hypothetical protein
LQKSLRSKQFGKGTASEIAEELKFETVREGTASEIAEELEVETVREGHGFRDCRRA